MDNPLFQPTQHSMKRRMWHHDYSAVGTYLITIETEGRKPLLGTLVGQPKPHIELSDLGQTILVDELPKMSQFYPMIEVWRVCIMPDHIHMIIHVKSEMPKGTHLGRVIRGFKAGCTQAYARTLGVKTPRPVTPVSDVPVIPESTVPVTPNSTVPVNGVFTPKASLFAPGYNDQILFENQQLVHWKAYLDDNPRRLWLKRENPFLFQLRRDTKIFIGKQRHELTFSSLGNHFLLDYPVRQQVQCSRSMTPEEIEAMKTAMLTASTETGAVSYSAAISEGEKLISRALRGANLPMVILLKDGFPPAGSEQERFFKPGGVFFEACAAGRLLLLEVPESMFDDEWIKEITHTALMRKAQSRGHSYTELPTSSSRFRFMALNEIGHLLVNQ